MLDLFQSYREDLMSGKQPFEKLEVLHNVSAIFKVVASLKVR